MPAWPPYWYRRRRDRDGREPRPGDVMDRLHKVTTELEQVVQRLEQDTNLDGIPDAIQERPA